MNPTIKKVAILGSGIMGSRIACHFAGIGVQVLLLDMVSPDAKPGASKAERNKLVNIALQTAIKSNPSPIYTADVPKRITTGNFEDDLSGIGSCDWIIEAIVEKLHIKQQLFERVEQFRKPGTLVSTNTSGIPIQMIAEGRSEDFQQHFCGTHFFNPPRYLRLLEIIPTPKTKKWVVDFLLQYGDLFLGKTTVLCNDTPGFIANRIGIFSIMAILEAMEKTGLTVDDVEALTGPIIGRPKSATFRTADVVGIDTLVHVAKGLFAHCPDDEARDQFRIPAWLQQMIDNNWLGDKSGQGFFKKTKTAAGGKEILTLDLKTLEYGARKKTRFDAIDAAKAIEDLPTRIKTLCAFPDLAGDFYRSFHYGLFAYVSNRVPVISSTLQGIDDALKAGFGWEIGAFETWDLLGVEQTVSEMKKAGHVVAPWVDDMMAAGVESFFTVKDGKRFVYSPVAGAIQPVYNSVQERSFIVMKNFSGQTVWK
ncbi:MAG: hypothetical protein RJB31_2062, partial [Bacteroidota bacterium]